MHLGRNQETAKFGRISTDRVINVADIAYSLLSRIDGMLFVLDAGSDGQPVDFGNFYELCAIVTAV